MSTRTIVDRRSSARITSNRWLLVGLQAAAGSSAAAFMHLVAGIVTVSLILAGYARLTRNSTTQ